LRTSAAEGTRTSELERTLEELFLRSPAENPFVSSEDDLSDVSVYHQLKGPDAVTEYTLLDVTDGPKTVIGGEMIGDSATDTAATENHVIGPVTVDGVANDLFPANIANYGLGQDNATDYYAGFAVPPIRYDSSLKVEWEHRGTGRQTHVCFLILGSGPHSIAVVKDGEPVYMQARNVSEETIEEMNVPSGYRIVRNPDITHPNPQTLGMWDDDKEEVVDHPYWKPFHDKLDEVRRLARLHSEETVRRKVAGTPKLPGDVKPDWPLPENHQDRDPEFDACEWWVRKLEQTRKRLPELDEII